MAGIRARIVQLLAAVLLWQTALAPAHCLAHAARVAASGSIICSAGGERVVHVGPDGEQAPAPAADPSFCAACHALPEAAPVAAPVPPPPAWVALPAAWVPGAPEALPLGARAPPFASRAPPALS